MKNLRNVSVLLFSLALAVGQAVAQYWGERALEKGFEQTEFHFAPANLVPYGLGTFAGTTPGLLRDPLLDLVLNPAHLRLDSLHNEILIYTDFRASRNVKQNDAYVIPMYNRVADIASSMYRSYPMTYVTTRKVLEPVFSGAIIGRPFRELDPDLLVGATYQLMLQDEKYYDVPSDIYRNVLGADYTGRDAAATSSGMTITDRYSGDDKMHQSGHFFSLFVQDRVLPFLEVGAKLGRVMHLREGAYGNTNLWDSYYSSQSTSLWSNREKRDQGYQHWEVNGGLLFRLSENVTLGASAGHVWGVGTQALTHQDTSYYAYASGSSSSSMYMSSGGKLSQWRHDGTSTEMGLELRAKVGSRALMTLFYRPRWTNVSLSNSSFINDTSSSFYTWMNNTELVTSRSRSHLLDRRSGGGEDKTTTDLFLATVNWDIDQHVTLSLGAQLELFTRDITTDEAVEVNGVSGYTSTYSSAPYSSLHENLEVKNLHWAFNVKRTSFRIPVFVTIRASEVAGVLLGISRDLSRWQIDDVTLATFQRRYMNDNGTVTDKGNFGERYTQPQEISTDITTTFMAGLTIAPSRLFQARLLMVPVYADGFDGPELQQLQWWLGITVTP